MRAILIDPFTQSISEVNYSGNFREIYEHIDAETFDVARISETDTVFVDDEGILKQIDAAFIIDGYHHPLVGRGLVLGSDAEGETVDCRMTIEEAMERVTFGRVRYFE